MTENTKAELDTARATCDLILERATAMMVNEASAPIPMVLDRLITYVVAQAVTSFGPDQAVNMLKFAAGRVEAGAFDHLVPDMNTVN